MEMKDALKIARDEEPRLRPYSAVETNSAFIFGMGLPNGSPIGNNCSFVVEKSGKFSGWVPIPVLHEKYRPEELLAVEWL